MNSLSSNQRLEFLGDAVLQLIIGDLVYSKYPELHEGDLSKLRASLVCEQSLAKKARELDLASYMNMSRGEFNLKVQERDSVLADAFEAVMGAVFKDSDYEVSNKVIVDLFHVDVEEHKKTYNISDYKTNLQEKIQSKSKTPITYRTVDEIGPDHDKIFVVEVVHDNKVLGRGQGKTKKEAEQHAAQQALKM